MERNLALHDEEWVRLNALFAAGKSKGIDINTFDNLSPKRIKNIKDAEEKRQKELSDFLKHEEEKRNRERIKTRIIKK